MSRRPNILVFLTDDHGHWAANCFGTREILSPNLDFLAATGTHLAHAFTPSPVCTPARATFFTGRLASQHGCHDYFEEVGGKSSPHPGILEQETIATRLKAAGYRTGLSGKWHCGNFETAHPGFDMWFTSLLGTNANIGTQRYTHNGETVEWDGHQAPVVTDAAIRFLRDSASCEEPWFLFVGYTDTHTPHNGSPERLVRHYREHATFTDIPNVPNSTAHGIPRQRQYAFARDNQREELSHYYAAVTHIDEQLGRIFDELDTLGQMDDTLIVYTGDHGHMNGHHGLHCKGNTTVPQNFIEESIRVPGLIRWPGHVEAGARADYMTDHCDLHQTLLEAAGITLDTESPGQSFLAGLRGEVFAGKSYQFGEYANAQFVRSERYKLIKRFAGPNGHFPNEFYDLETDPEEEQNRYQGGGYTAVIAEMEAALDSHFARFHVVGREGWEIASQPRFNTRECWRVDPKNVDLPVPF